MTQIIHLCIYIYIHDPVRIYDMYGSIYINIHIYLVRVIPLRATSCEWPCSESAGAPRHRRYGDRKRVRIVRVFVKVFGQV